MHHFRIPNCDAVLSSSRASHPLTAAPYHTPCPLGTVVDGGDPLTPPDSHHRRDRRSNRRHRSGSRSSRHSDGDGGAAIPEDVSPIHPVRTHHHSPSSHHSHTPPPPRRSHSGLMSIGSAGASGTRTPKHGHERFQIVQARAVPTLGEMEEEGWGAEDLRMPWLWRCDL